MCVCVCVEERMMVCGGEDDGVCVEERMMVCGRESDG